MRRLPSRIPTSLAVALAAGLVTAATPAEAAGYNQPVACGSHIAADAVLTKDLLCKGAGLILAPGVTLDLNGHTLTGDGTGVAISVVDGHDNAVVDGKIRNWEGGINFVGPDSEDLKPLRLAGLRFIDAPLRFEAAAVTIDRSHLLRSPVFPAGSSLTVRKSVLRSSSTFGELNVVTVVDSLVIGGGLALDENNSLIITRSRLNGTGYAGWPLVCSADVSITDSEVTNYSAPISRANFCELRVVGTRFTNNPDGAIESEFSDTPTVVSNSTFRNSGVAISGSSLQVTGSRFVGNTIGVAIDDPVGSVITGSVFRRNTSSGVYTDGTGLAVGSNKAVNNGE